MAQTTYGQTSTTSSYVEPRTGWTGWVAFAGIMMIIGGLLNAFYGFVAIVNDQWVVWTNRADIYLDVSQWGWVHLIVGLVVVACGFGVFTGNVLARMIGVVIAALSLIVNFFYIPAYPFWTLTVMVIDALVIWALTVHGGEMRDA